MSSGSASHRAQTLRSLLVEVFGALRYLSVIEREGTLLGEAGDTIDIEASGPESWFWNRLFVITSLGKDKISKLLDNPVNEQVDLAVANVVGQLENALTVPGDGRRIHVAEGRRVQKLIDLCNIHESGTGHQRSPRGLLCVDALKDGDFLWSLNYVVDRVAVVTEENVPKPAFRLRPDQGYSHSATKGSAELFQAVLRYLECCGHSHDAAVRIGMATHRNQVSSNISFDADLAVCLECPEDIWKKIKISVKSTSSQTWPPQRAGQRGVAFNMDSPSSSPQENRDPTPRPFPLEELCAVIKNGIGERPKSYLLNMNLENGVLFKLKSTPGIPTATQRNPVVVTLGQLLTQRCILGDRAKRVLAIILSHAFIHFYGGPWLKADSWSSDDVLFVEEDARLYMRPYVAQSFRSGSTSSIIPGPLLLQHRHPAQSGDIDPDDLDIPPFPGLIKLGIVLLEIFCNRPIKSLAEEYGVEQESIPVGDFNTLHSILTRDNDITPLYKSAIDACLKFDIAMSLDNEDQEDEYDRKFRQIIYEKIIAPLEIELLYGGHKANLQDLDSQFADEPIRDYRRNNTARTASSNDGSAQKHEPVATAEITPPRRAANRSIDGFFDDSTNDNTQNALDPQSCQYSDSFVEQYLEIQEALLHPPADAVDHRRVRIAVLDTGVDCTHANIGQLNISGGKSFLDKGVLAWTRDSSGHGSHVTSIIGRLAPDAEIYIAKIAVNKIAGPNDVAQALNHAVKSWEVDLICMSFGFRRTSNDAAAYTTLETAIQNAAKCGALLFVAASNEGGNAGRAYPASDLQDVICMHSTDGQGNVSKFNPTPLKNAVNFATLGQDVAGDCPVTVDEAGTIRRSGTSMATPVALTIAAAVISWAQIHLEPRHVMKLKNVGTMKAVLKKISKERQGFYYLSLNYFMDFQRNPEYVKETIRRVIDQC